MEQVTYGFYASDIALLADSLSRILRIQLYLQHSPMCGPWYCSQDLSALARVLKQALEKGEIKTAEEISSAANRQPLFELSLHDPDPYYCPEFPEYVDEVHCLLRLRASPVLLSEIEVKLRASGLKYIELKRKQAEK